MEGVLTQVFSLDEV